MFYQIIILIKKKRVFYIPVFYSSYVLNSAIPPKKQITPISVKNVETIIHLLVSFVSIHKNNVVKIPPNDNVNPM